MILKIYQRLLEEVSDLVFRLGETLACLWAQGKEPEAKERLKM